MSIPSQHPKLQKFVDAFNLKDCLNRDLLRCLSLFSFTANTEICSQDTEQTHLYLLVSGKVQVNYYHPNGKLAVLAMLTPLAVIGDLELFQFADTKTSVLTMQPTTLLGIEKGFALQYGYNDPVFLRFIIQNLTTKLYGSSITQVQKGLPLVNHFAAYLLRQPATAEGEIVLESKSYLAGLMGVTLRQLNRVIKRLEVEQCIESKRNRIRILNRALLEAYAEK